MENRILQKLNFFISLIGGLCSIISLIMTIFPDFNTTSSMISFLIERCPYVSLFSCMSCYITYNFIIPKYKVNKQDIPTEEARPSYIFNFLLVIIISFDLVIIFSTKYSYAGSGGEYANEYFKLQQSYNELQQLYNESQKSNFGLQQSYDVLMQSYDLLQQSYFDLLQSYNETQQSNDELQQSYDELEQSYSKLQQSYDELEQFNIHMMNWIINNNSNEIGDM